MSKWIIGDFIMSETMTEEQVYEQLQAIVASQLVVDPKLVVKGASFTEDLNADSLDVVELVMRFEETFDIPIADEVAGDMSTVQDAVTYITKAIEEKAS